MKGPRSGVRPGTFPGRFESLALGAFVAVQTLIALVRHDRPEVLFWWDRAAAPLVAALWLRNLALAAAAGAVAVLLLRWALPALAPDPARDAASRAERRLAIAAVVAAVAAGAILRWAFTDGVPPGLWRDVVLSVRPALRSPGDVPFLGGAFVGDDAPITGEALSGPYLLFGRATLVLFGRGDAGLLAVSALPGCVAIAAIALLARELAGWQAAAWAAWLAAACRWPLTLSRFGYTASASIPLVALAAAFLLRSLRTGRNRDAAVAGLAAALALQTYAAAWAVVPALVVAWWVSVRDGGERRRAALGTALVVAGALAYAWALHAANGRLGGRAAEAGVWTPVKDVGLRWAGEGFGGILWRAASATVEYTGLFLWTSDPVARHGLPDRPPFSPPVGAAALLGLAVLAARSRGGDRRALVLLAVAAGALGAGIFSNPTGAPNSMRASLLMVPSLAAAAFVLRGASRGVRPGVALGAVAAWCLAFEAVPVLSDWPYRRETRQDFREAQTRAGRALRVLAPDPVLLDPAAVRNPLVVETLASSPDAQVAVPRMPRVTPGQLLRLPPHAPSWYVTDRAGAAALRAGGAAVSRDVGMGTEGGEIVLVRLKPPR